MPEVDVQLLIRAARQGRNRLMLEVAYYGALPVSELVGLSWRQVIPRESGEVQLAVVGKGDKARNVLLPPEIGSAVLAMHGDAPTRPTPSRTAPRSLGHSDLKVTSIYVIYAHARADDSSSRFLKR